MNPCWLETLERLIPEEQARHSFQAIAISSMNVDTRDVKFLVFVDQRSEPLWVLHCRHNRSIANREVVVLAELQRRGFRVQPEVLGEDVCADMYARLLRFCPGQRRNVRLWQKPSALRMLMAEIAQVQLALADWARSTFDTGPLPIGDLSEFVQRAGGAGDTGELTRALTDAREALVCAGAPRLPQHGDCWIPNVLWNQGHIRLLDWEHFGLVFEPFLDAWTFVLSMCEDSGDHDAASLFVAGPNATAAECAIRQYASLVGLAPELGRASFPLVLASLIHVNVLVGRIAVARRISRALTRYLGARSHFMIGLRTHERVQPSQQPCAVSLDF